jgi:hypothetical protein
MNDTSHSQVMIKTLEEYHDKALPGQARVYYVEALAPYSPAILTDAARRWMDQNSPSIRFPSLSQLRACIDESRTRMWARTKATENRQPLTQPTVTEDPAYHRACWDLIRRASSMTKDELVDAFEAHDKQWPGHDWDGAARRLRGHSARRAA